MNTCLNCNYARQVGDKKRQDVVGCAIINDELMSIKDVLSGAVYEGWIYCGRRVGDVAESKKVRKGCSSKGCNCRC